jgi:hypothetical protein
VTGQTHLATIKDVISQLTSFNEQSKKNGVYTIYDYNSEIETLLEFFQTNGKTMFDTEASSAIQELASSLEVFSKNMIGYVGSATMPSPEPMLMESIQKLKRLRDGLGAGLTKEVQMVRVRDQLTDPRHLSLRMFNTMMSVQTSLANKIIEMHPPQSLYEFKMKFGHYLQIPDSFVFSPHQRQEMNQKFALVLQNFIQKAKFEGNRAVRLMPKIDASNMGSWFMTAASRASNNLKTKVGTTAQAATKVATNAATVATNVLSDLKLDEKTQAYWEELCQDVNNYSIGNNKKVFNLLGGTKNAAVLAKIAQSTIEDRTKNQYRGQLLQSAPGRQGGPIQFMKELIFFIILDTPMNSIYVKLRNRFGDQKEAVLNYILTGLNQTLVRSGILNDLNGFRSITEENYNETMTTIKQTIFESSSSYDDDQFENNYIRFISNYYVDHYFRAMIFGGKYILQQRTLRSTRQYAQRVVRRTTRRRRI